MEELREQLVFQDHLVAAVRDWKNHIIAEQKSDKNIIFIGVHCRNNDSQPEYKWKVSPLAFFSSKSVFGLTVFLVQTDGLQTSL